MECAITQYHVSDIVIILKITQPNYHESAQSVLLEAMFELRYAQDIVNQAS
jgi:hypothetical protein